MLSNASEGSPGHGQVHPLPKGASVMGVAWDLMIPVWCRPGLPCLSNVARPIQIFRAAMMGAWRDTISGPLCKKRKGFRGGPLVDVYGSMQLLGSLHAQERGEALPRKYSGRRRLARISS